MTAARPRPPMFWAVVAAAWLVLVACGGSGEGNTTAVHIGNVTVRAEVARTLEERAQGLGDRDTLELDAGMLFIEGSEDIPGFWMRDMRFPLDFIWISRDLHVVDVTQNVPVDEHTTNVADISPSVPVLYVLEVNAGFVAKAGVQLGDTVHFDPDVSAP